MNPIKKIKKIKEDNWTEEDLVLPDTNSAKCQIDRPKTRWAKFKEFLAVPEVLGTIAEVVIDIIIAIIRRD